ncbi:hypothetical protein PRO82_001438 [Candidatus Protochlamydia amoebophila]|nr:hypothetical protein [Candidatus Protochlamydia amoebophila]
MPSHFKQGLRIEFNLCTNCPVIQNRLFRNSLQGIVKKNGFK